ncbi:hypothetical protein BDF22DRAFT_680465 [Syncephalis plumigaleata]|nr:hypothetical protein BDF22DRAFT_680465 [Syncephalis plumigaleata]
MNQLSSFDNSDKFTIFHIIDDDRVTPASFPISYIVCALLLHDSIGLNHGNTMTYEQNSRPYIRRASAGTRPETVAEEQTRQAGHALAHALKTTLNDASIGLYRVCEHVEKRVPQIVQDKRNLRRLEERQWLAQAIRLAANAQSSSMDVS